jgi:hypothetical protein
MLAGRPSDSNDSRGHDAGIFLCLDPTDMHQADPIYQRIISLYAEQDGLPLSPSFVAYELDMTALEAEELLDELVKQSVLEFDFDQGGEVYYSLSAAYMDVRTGPAPNPRLEDSAWGSTDGRVSQQPYMQSGFAQNGFDGDVAVAAPTKSRSSRNPYRSSRPSRSSRRNGSSRQSRSTRRSSRRSRNYGPAAESPATDRWAEIGPNGCDGSVGNPGEAQPIFHAATAQQTRPPSSSPWSEHRRYAGLNEHPGTQMVRNPPNSLPARKVHRAEPMLAAILSLFFAGSGQLYNGQVGKGIAFFISFLLLWAFALGWMVQIWAAVDAYQVAESRRDPT